MPKQDDVQERAAQRPSGRSLIVLGMHRSGTSAITGTLRLCGAWAGKTSELTGANVENPKGFWERHDIRQICDHLLLSAGATWWNIANFNLESIPHAVLAEQRRHFKEAISVLDEHVVWIIKEPRLCLLFPVLRDYVKNPICIYIYRNPLEVARSLQARNGFSIASGLALWEAYNLHALSASKGLPCIPIFHEALMLHPVETLNALVEKLDDFAVGHPVKLPDRSLIEQFIDPGLYHKRATNDETEEYLLTSQRALWSRLRSGNALGESASISGATKQHLFDLEGVEHGAMIEARDATIADLRSGAERLRAALEGRGATIEARDATIADLRSGAERLKAALEGRGATIEARDATIADLRSGAERLKAALEGRGATIEARDKTIADLRSGAERLKAALEGRGATIEARDATIADLRSGAERLKAALEGRGATIEARDKTIADLRSGAERLKAALEGRGATIEARDKTIADLRTSTSWKITAPLRTMSRNVTWLQRNCRRVLKRLVCLGTGQFSQAMGCCTFTKSGARIVLRAEDQQLGSTDHRLLELIREHKTKGHSERNITQRKSADAVPNIKVTVIAWNLTHNALGRTYLLADVLRQDYDVELIGAKFSRLGDEVWEPLRDCSRVTIKAFPGHNFPEHFNRMGDIAKQIDGDVIYVSKPRLPSLELAILAKLYQNRPVVLDVDDYELGWFKNREPLTLEAVKTQRHKRDFNCPYHETWSRYSESLIPLFERVTVSNEELRRKFGGMILPHIRDEHDFDPDLYSRNEIRAELGFTPKDKVILFIGTPRVHKGLAQITNALKKSNRPDYKLLIVGSPVDAESRRFYADADPRHVKIIPNNISFGDMPGYLRVGDLICLLQDVNGITSKFQMPAKVTDGLSMGIPMLGTNVPPLVNLANDGLIELVGDTPLDRKIDEIFSNYETYKQRAERNRETFLQEYSYGANLPKLKQMINGLLNNPMPIPDEFRDLVAYHRKIFSSNAALLPRTTIANGQSTYVLCPAVPPARSVAGGGKSSYVDEKLDIVFFWKQNDSGIYGRRQDMLVKYLAKDPKVNRILHFDAPINLFRDGKTALRDVVQDGPHTQGRYVFRQTLRRKFRRSNKDKILSDVFIWLTKEDRRVPGFLKWIIPSRADYLDFLGRVMKRHGVGRRRTIFWVCPNNLDFPSIVDRFKPDLVVSDVIDDQRRWPADPKRKESLRRNYEEVLALSHLTFANCHSVFEGMRQFTDSIHLLPNAAELLEEESRNWIKPKELRQIDGPVIGYVGNLDIVRIDLDLLMTVAAERPDWNLVFIGSMHRNADIYGLDRFRNVYFLGVRPYDQAMRYIRHFDVAIIPHLDNELTRVMNPLKLYVYFSLYVPVVITRIANADDFGEFTQIGHTPRAFIERIAYCLDNDIFSGKEERIRALLKANSWEDRVASVLALIEAEFGKIEAPGCSDRPV